MKRIFGLIIAAIMMLSTVGTVSFAAGGDEATITSPSNGDWLDPHKSIKVTWTAASGGASYRITIKNANGKYVVQNKPVSGTSYIISSNTLDFEECYIIWVGTYDGDSARGGGNSIKVNINDRYSSEKIYEEATIAYPENGGAISADSDLTIKLNGNSDLAYVISVQDIDAKKYVAQNQNITSASYKVKKNQLTPGHKYKVWVGTYKKASSEGKLFGAGKEIVFSVEKSESKPPEYPRNPSKDGTVSRSCAKISYPSEKAWLDPTKKITLKWKSSEENLKYTVSLKDDNSGKYLVKEKQTTDLSYCVDANTLAQQQAYRFILTTYYGGEKIGSDEVLFYTTEAKYSQATFASVSDGDILDSAVTNVLRFSGTGAGFCYKITIVDINSEKDVVRNKEAGSNSYTINANTLEPGKEYKLWLGTFLESDPTVSVGNGDIVYISTKEEKKEPEEYEKAVISFPENDEWLDPAKKIKIKWKNVSLDSEYIISIKNDVTGEYVIKDKRTSNSSYSINANVLENEQRYKILLITYYEDKVIGSDEVLFNTNGAEAPESGFSATGIVKPTGILKYQKGFSVKGVVGSAYPITEAKIVIFAKGNENNVEDIVHLKNYNKTAEDANKFDINKYDSEVNFGILKPGDYTYRVSVVDSMGVGYIAAESNFSIVREKGTYDDVSADNINYEAIKQLTIKGVLAGDGTGNFRPYDSITRAEFVKMLYFAFDLPSVTSRDLKSEFSDVNKKHWAYTYIMSAFNKNIINGKGNGKFAPNDNVTFEEVAKMLICIKGWGDVAEENGGWAGGGYITVADKNNFFKSTSVANRNYKRNASRADVAQMFYNALNKKSNSVSGASTVYTVNGNKLYAYNHYASFYVDTSVAMPLFNGYDVKATGSTLKGTLQIWDKNISDGGKSLKVDYDFEGNNPPYQELDIRLTETGVPLSETSYKIYFRQNKVSLALKDDRVMINVNDLAMLTNSKIENGEIVPDPVRDISIFDGKIYSNKNIVKKAQVLYDVIENLGGHAYLMSRIEDYELCFDGAYEAYSKVGNIKKVENAVGYLTSATISVGSLCVGNIVGIGEIAGAVVPSVSFDYISNRFEESLDTESDFVYLLLSESGTRSYDEFIVLHSEIDRDNMTKEEAAEYLTLYYKTKIDNATVLMAFSYFAEKCPEHFGESLFRSAKAAFGPILSALTGDILKQYDISSLTNDLAHFYCGNAGKLIDSMIASNNEILVNWAKEVNRLENELNEALFSEEAQAFDVPGRFV